MLISGSTVAMVIGYREIRRRRVRRHAGAMKVAFALAAAFLVCFVVRYVAFGQTPFVHGGALRVLYLVIWFSHEPIAVVSVPLVVGALVLALRRRFSAHSELAPFALATWFYASVTGVAIFVLVYLC